jgi:hypothetical protein
LPPDVFAFEANPVCHSSFIANVDANRLESVITLASVALSDMTGTMTLHQGAGILVDWPTLDPTASQVSRGMITPA